MGIRMEEIARFSVSLITIATGLILNGFIAAVPLRDWLKGRKVKATNKIQCAIAISRVGHLCICSYHIYLLFLKNHMDMDSTYYFVVRFFYLVFMYSSLWFATLLSVFYFMKVSNYKNSLFLHLKSAVLGRVQGFIVGVSAVSLSYSCLHVWFISNYTPTLVDVAGEHSENNTCKFKNVEEYHYFYITGNVGPFIIYTVSFVLLLMSLCCHLKRMRSRDPGFTSTHSESYYVAIKSIAACFFIFSLLLATNILYMMTCNSVSTKTWAYMLVYIFPILHSSYLIYGNPKLRQQFCVLPPHGKTCWVRRGDAESNLSGP